MKPLRHDIVWRRRHRCNDNKNLVLTADTLRRDDHKKIETKVAEVKVQRTIEVLCLAGVAVAPTVGVGSC